MADSAKSLNFPTGFLSVKPKQTVLRIANFSAGFLSPPTETVFRFSFFIAVVTVLLSLTSCIRLSKPPPVAKQGQMDVTAWDFKKDGSLNLQGEWEFYWNQLLTPTDFQKSPAPVLSGYSHVVGAWNKETIGNTQFPGQGFATYRLTINKRDATGLLALKLMDMGSSYRLWVNDRLIASNGKVTSDRASFIPQFLPLAVSFEDHSDTLQLLVQVANFFHSEAGLWKNIYLGDEKTILQQRETELILQCSLAGAVLILFIYHIFIFLLRRKDYVSLWFALLCLDAFIRIVLTGERVLYHLLPEFPLSIGLKIEYTTVTLGLPLYVMVAYEFFSQDFSKMIRNVIVGIGIIETIWVGLAPATLYTATLPVILGIVLLECLYLLILVIRAMIHRRKFAVLSFIVYCLQLVAMVNDVLYANLVVNGGYLLMYAFITFLMVQAYILAYHFSQAHKKAEKLSVDLNTANIELEQKVDERTKELKGANVQLLSEKQKTEDLLLNILPEEIAKELRETGAAKARRYPSITVLFTDFMNFTRVSEELTPEQLVKEIDFCYRAYDQIIGQYGLEKIKTMGDSYICAGGLPKMNFTHPEDVINAALDIRDFMNKYCDDRRSRGETTFEIRIGVHTGPAVAGIVGAKKFAYDIWGDSVNLAARMESSGLVGKVNISHSTFQLVKDKFACTYRGKIEAKNKGEVDMYFAERL